MFESLFLAVQTLTGNPVINKTMVLLAEYLVVLLPLTLVYLWLQGRKAKQDSLLTFLGSVTGLIAAYGMSLFYFHQNPSATYETIAEPVKENAFPSQHTAVIFSAAWPLFYLKRKKLGGLMLLAALATGFSRVYIGEHWPIDIFGAFIASIAALGAAILLEDRIALAEPLFQLSERIEEKLTELLPIKR